MNQVTRKKTLLAVVLSAVMAVSAAQTQFVFAEESAVQLGAAKLEGTFNDSSLQDYYLEGEGIYANGQYDMTWDISGAENFDDADSIELRVNNIDPNPLGINGNVKIVIDEVWLDGVQVTTLTGEPGYATKTDHGYEIGEITTICVPLRNAKLNDLDMEFTESVRIVFTLSNLSGAPAVYGDINADGIVNASDAACILQYAAAVGAGYTGTLEEYMAK
ncbi:MAG: hypothetical protein E7502_03405 [Ruminococcus sp.]|nr:hypothetical protein [Ruminococcus sp.]